MTSVLMVTPFAPYRDGIATYASQELRRLRSDGHAVEVVSPLPSAAHHHLPLGGARGAAQLVQLGSRFDRVVIQFGPELLFGRCRAAGERVAVWMSLAALARATNLDLRLHEIEYGALEQNPAERQAARTVFGWADRVTVHTKPERDRLRPVLGATADRIELIDHGAHFAPAVDLTPAQAKAELGLDPTHFTFLSIGFLQRHKGFDRGVEAFAVAELPGARLHIVGSGRVDHPEIGRYVAELEQMCRRTPGVELHNRYVSDDQFDVWLTAADAVVLPYREIWSSGVVERARLFGKPIIASDLDQLADQLGDDGVACGDVDEFAIAMEKLWSAAGHSRVDASGVEAGDRGREGAGSGERRRPPRPVWDVDDTAPDRASVQAQIQARAAAGHGEPAAFRPVSPVSAAGSGAAGRSSAVPPIPGSAESLSLVLRSLGPLEVPEPVSARPGVTPVKQTVRRLTSWQLDPLARRLTELQQATIDAVVEMETRLERLSEDIDDRTG